MTYIVFGDRGEYSDYQLWAVRAFDNEAEAERFKEECQRIYDDARDKSDNEDWYAWTHPFDPDAGGTYSRVRYTVSEVPFGWPPMREVET